MQKSKFLPPIASICLAASVLTACGGGNVPGTEFYTADFSNQVSRALSILTPTSEIDNPSIKALFSDAFKDGGYTKAQLATDLAANAAALATDPDLSLFPMGSLSNVTISGCDASTSICTLSATLTNTDADITEVTFTTRVMLAKSSYVFFGDQGAS